jgi:hypothetical protein
MCLTILIVVQIKSVAAVKMYAYVSTGFRPPDTIRFTVDVKTGEPTKIEMLRQT